MSSPRDDPSSDEAAPNGGGGDRPDGPQSPPGPRSDGGDPDAPTGTGPLALVRQFFRSENGVVVFVRELLSSAAIVLAIGLVLFAVSGVWPPMVAIESGSMEPQMYKGDLVFVMEEHRLAPDAAQAGTGVVTYRAGAESGYSKFNNPGDVVIYKPDGRDYETPIIHRAMFWVEEGENWYDKADQSHLRAENCAQLDECPATHSGFITKGDNNQYYDQSERMDISGPVKSEWVRGTAELRVPWLGWVRLYFSGAA